MQQQEFDLVVIGGGPGGYTAAIRAAQLGMSVACVEKESSLGGTCLRVGCIPSKALLESSEQFQRAGHGLAAHGILCQDVQLDLAAMLGRKDKVVRQLTGGIDFLFKKNKITRFLGHGSFQDPHTILVQPNDGDPHQLRAKRVLIATGSRVASLPGIQLDCDRIGSSTEALSYPEVPEQLVVIGAGVIGLELGSVWSRLGSKVTVLEYLDRILPEMDGELAAEALKTFKRQGMEFRLGSRVTGATTDGTRCTVQVEGADPLECDRVLVAVGRSPNTEGLGLEQIGLELVHRGQIPVDDHWQTPIDGVFAIGDVIRGPMLAHKAQDEGIACVEYMATGYGHVNYDAIPGVVYTQPEIASVGATEEQLKSQGIPYRRGVFPLAANGRALAMGHGEGRVKVLAHEQTDRILGVHIIGYHAGDMIAEAAVAIEFGASSEDLGMAVHAHPTLAECVKEACLDVTKRATYI